MGSIAPTYNGGLTLRTLHDLIILMTPDRRNEHLYLLGFTFAIGAQSIFEEVEGFSPLWFPRGKTLCLLSPVIVDVHVILSNKILDHIE